jgi:hypothetical protein
LALQLDALKIAGVRDADIFVEKNIWKFEQGETATN